MDLCLIAPYPASDLVVLAGLRCLRECAGDDGESQDAMSSQQDDAPEDASGVIEHRVDDFATRKLVVQHCVADLEKSPWVGSSLIELKRAHSGASASQLMCVG